MKNEALVDLIANRLTTREFKTDVPRDEDIQRILDVACDAPYGGGQPPPWKFLVVRDRKKVELMAEAIRDAIRKLNDGKLDPKSDFFGTYFERAPVVVVCAWRLSCIEPDWKEKIKTDPVLKREATMVGLMSLGHAMENLFLAARALGLGAGYIGPCHDDPRLEEIVSLEEPFTVAAIVPIGYPAKHEQKERIDKTGQVIVT